MYLSISLSIYLYIYLSIYLASYLSIYLSVCLSVYLSIYLSPSIYLHLSIYLSFFLSFYLSVCLSIFHSFYPSIHPSIYLFLILSHLITLAIYLSIYLSICPSICPSIYLSIHPSIYLSICLSMSLSLSLSSNYPIYLSIYLSLCLSLSISLSVCLSIYLQAWKRSDFAKRPLFLNLTTSKTQQFSETSSILHLTTSKTKQFCETSSSFKLTTSKTKQFGETSFKNGKLRAELTAWYHCVLRCFDSTCLNYCACHEKALPGHTKCCTCHAKSSQQTWRWAPGPPNISDKHVSCTAPATENPSLQILFTCPRPAIVFGNATKPLRFAHFWQGPQPLAPATQKHIWTSKSARAPGVFNILTSKCVQFFDIATSKSGLNLRCFFVHFDFAPQQRTLFRHLNFQKCSEHGVLCTFWLRNLLHTTTASTFPTSQLPKAVRTWGVLYMLT